MATYVEDLDHDAVDHAAQRPEANVGEDSLEAHRHEHREDHDQDRQHHHHCNRETERRCEEERKRNPARERSLALASGRAVLWGADAAQRDSDRVVWSLSPVEVSTLRLRSCVG